MKRTVIMEVKKACGNKWFSISMAISLFLTASSAILEIQGYQFRTEILGDRIFQKNYHINAETMAAFWVGMDFSTWCATAFFFLLPLLASLPYGWSLCQELKTGYLKNIVSRIPRRQYLFAKYLATFFVGGITIFVPMLLNVLTVACFVPLRSPEVSECIYYGVYGDGLWADVFYSFPIVYIVLYLLLDFIFAGLWATVPLAINFAKNWVTALVIPFIFLLGFHYITSVLLFWQIRVGLSPLNFLRAANIGYGTNMGIVLSELAVLLFFSVFRVLIWRKRDVL